MTFEEENAIIKSLISDLTIFLGKRHLGQAIRDQTITDNLQEDLNKRSYAMNVFNYAIASDHRSIQKRLKDVAEIIATHNNIHGAGYYPKKTVTQASQYVTCGNCGTRLQGSGNQKYCSGKCRTAAYRKRQTD